MAVIYADIEKTLVAHLQTALGSTVYVATKKHAPGTTESPEPSKQVVVMVNWAGDKEQMIKYAGIVIEVFADTYADASTLALQVEAHLREATVGAIKKVSIIAGPIRIGDNTAQEKRSISAEAVVQAADL